MVASGKYKEPFFAHTVTSTVKCLLVNVTLFNKLIFLSLSIINDTQHEKFITVFFINLIICLFVKLLLPSIQTGALLCYRNYRH